MKDNHDEPDKILIKDLLLRCILGVNKFERREKQDVLINIELWCHLRGAAETDDIKRTVDYKEITKSVIKLVEDSTFFLVETLAEKIADVCLKRTAVRKVKVTVEKPGALRFARSVGAEIIRKQG